MKVLPRGDAHFTEQAREKEEGSHSVFLQDKIEQGICKIKNPLHDLRNTLPKRMVTASCSCTERMNWLLLMTAKQDIMSVENIDIEFKTVRENTTLE